MALQKRYLKNEKECRITFVIPKSVGDKFNTISLVGEFNDWNEKSNSFKRMKSNGSYTTSIKVPIAKKYQFRYLADNKYWFNETKADEQVLTPFGDSENSVISV